MWRVPTNILVIPMYNRSIQVYCFGLPFLHGMTLACMA